jgi:hypothetical protein
VKAIVNSIHLLNVIGISISETEVVSSNLPMLES